MTSSRTLQIPPPPTLPLLTWQLLLLLPLLLLCVPSLERFKLEEGGDEDAETDDVGDIDEVDEAGESISLEIVLRCCLSSFLFARFSPASSPLTLISLSSLVSNIVAVASFSCLACSSR